MITIEVERPFKNRGEVKDIINLCNIAAAIIVVPGLIFALVGVISDVMDKTLFLESSNWLLLAILFVVGSFGPNFNSKLAKHLYGIESEIKQK